MKNQIISHTQVSISGGVTDDPQRIIALLYEIGFLTAKKMNEDDSYEHYSFAQNPELFHNTVNFDQNMRWEIHPVFRQTLHLHSKDKGVRRTNRMR